MQIGRQKIFFSERVVENCNRLGKEVVESKTSNEFKRKLEIMNSIQMDLYMDHGSTDPAAGTEHH